MSEGDLLRIFTLGGGIAKAPRARIPQALPCQCALADFPLPEHTPGSLRDFSGTVEDHPAVLCVTGLKHWEIIMPPGAAQGMFCTFSQRFPGRLGSSCPQR